MEESREAISNIISANIDREVDTFLRKYNLPTNRTILRKKGYHLLIEVRELEVMKKEYTLFLCKIEDAKTFTIQTSINLS
jgi:hypothetical protein